jgi:glyoxylase-like metal-dependent hydrolase (beta-lactamase superfamily II)
MPFQSEDLTRRSFLSAASLAGGSYLLGASTASAKAPQIRRNGPAFYRFGIGDIELTSIYDGNASRPLTEAYVRNVPLPEVQAAFASALRSTAITETPFSFLAANTGEMLVLIDTGSGGAYLPGVDNGAANLAAAGIDPLTVDMVVITHFHGDHTFGLTDAAGKPRFLNAEILVPEIEHRFLIGNDPLPDFKLAPLNLGASGARQRLTAYGNRVRPYRDGQELASGITALATPGHSPGHMSMRISSGEEQMLVLGDVITLPALFVAHPGWHMFLDQEPQLAEATRRKILDQAAAAGLLVAGTHFPFPALGRIVRGPAGFEYIPEPWRARA